MPVLRDEIEEIAKHLKKTNKLTDYEALTIATKLQMNRILDDTREVKAELNRVLSDAFGTEFPSHGPRYLEAIAMQLGYNPNGRLTITDALFSISESMQPQD